MSIPPAGTIDEQIHRFVSGVIDLDELEDWTLLHAWNVHATVDPHALRLTRIVQELALAVNNGAISEDDARSVLGDDVKVA
jgi:hypothetical protein